MLAWKTLSLLVAAAVAMHGASAVSQGQGGGMMQSSDLPPTSAYESVPEEPVDAYASSEPETDKESTDLTASGDVEDASMVDQTSNLVPESSGTDESSPDSSSSSDLDTEGATSITSALGSDANDEASSVSGSLPIDSYLTGSSEEMTSSLDSESSAEQSTQGSMDQDATQEGTLDVTQDAPLKETEDQGTPTDDGTQDVTQDGTQDGTLDVTQDAPLEETEDQSTPTDEAGDAATVPTGEIENPADVPSADGGDLEPPVKTDVSTATESSDPVITPSTGASCKRRLRRN